MAGCCSISPFGSFIHFRSLRIQQRRTDGLHGDALRSFGPVRFLSFVLRDRADGLVRSGKYFRDDPFTPELPHGAQSGVSHT